MAARVRRQRAKQVSAHEASELTKKIYVPEEGRLIRSTTIYHRDLHPKGKGYAIVEDYLRALMTFFWARYELRVEKNRLQMFLDPLLTQQYKKKDGTVNKPELSLSRHWTFKLKNKKWRDNLSTQYPDREYVVAADLECYDTPDVDFTADYEDKLYKLLPGQRATELGLGSFDVGDLNEPTEDDNEDDKEERPSPAAQSGEPSEPSLEQMLGRSEGSAQSSDKPTDDATDDSTNKQAEQQGPKSRVLGKQKSNFDEVTKNLPREFKGNEAKYLEVFNKLNNTDDKVEFLTKKLTGAEMIEFFKYLPTRAEQDALLVLPKLPRQTVELLTPHLKA